MNWTVRLLGQEPGNCGGGVVAARFKLEHDRFLVEGSQRWVDIQFFQQRNEMFIQWVGPL